MLPGQKGETNMSAHGTDEAGPLKVASSLSHSIGAVVASVSPFSRAVNLVDANLSSAVE